VINDWALAELRCPCQYNQLTTVVEAHASATVVLWRVNRGRPHRNYAPRFFDCLRTSSNSRHLAAPLGEHLPWDSLREAISEAQASFVAISSNAPRFFSIAPDQPEAASSDPYPH
jgi:hypothetical protein